MFVMFSSKLLYSPTYGVNRPAPNKSEKWTYKSCSDVPVGKKHTGPAALLNVTAGYKNAKKSIVTAPTVYHARVLEAMM
eukprot:m.1554610 g.1554610  ORF g.1554610 m.1554610 type:complete len:79 (-) comp25270_c1_seq53:1680-1916(-)